MNMKYHSGWMPAGRGCEGIRLRTEVGREERSRCGEDRERGKPSHEVPQQELWEELDGPLRPTLGLDARRYAHAVPLDQQHVKRGQHERQVRAARTRAARRTG